MKTALIIGGGDGGTASQVLKLGLENIVNVEIDSHVVEVSRRYFPSIARAFNDPHVKLIIGDGIKYVHDTEMKFDLVIIDSTDPVGPAEGLFDRKFYTDLKRILNRGGIVVTQSGSPFYQPKALTMAHGEMSSVFTNVRTYTAFIPSYPSGFWSFTMASELPIEPDGHDVQLKGKYFNNEVLQGAFRLPEFVKELIGKK
jgi:spermidine synthase